MEHNMAEKNLETVKKSPIPFFGAGAIAAVLIYAFLQLFHRPGVEPQQANESYRQGIEAKTVAEREVAFNKALDSYKQLDKDYHPTFGNGKLDNDIANAYFQLGEYSWAVLYDYRAFALMPRNENVEANLNVALSKLGIQPEETAGPIRNLFFFHYRLSLPERLQLFFVLSLLLLIGLSYGIWFPSRKGKYFTFIIGIFWATMLVSLCYTRFFAPIEGVVVNSTILYRDAGKQYAQAKEEPLLAGMKVQVLDVLQRGLWFKIITPDGTLGYVPQTSLQLIEEE